MLAIYKKELSSYFHTVIGWMFVAVNVFFLGLYFSILNMLYGSIYYANSVGSCGFIVMLAVPILTMRVLAEERKSRTDQLIFTAPVSVGKVVISKFFALATIFMIPCVVGLFGPIIMRIFGEVPLREAYTALLGYFLYGLAAIALGVFISSITDNQVIAAVVSFVSLLVLYMIGSIGSVIFSEENIIKSFFSAMDFSVRFESFLQGALDIRSVIFFLSVIVFLLFLTTQSIQKRRWSISRKSVGTGAYSVSMIVLACGILVAVNMIAAQLPENIASIDMTPNQLYSLTDDTKAYLKRFDQDVTIYVYAQESSMDTTVVATLEKYESLSSHIKVEYKDPAKYPNFGSEYTSSNLSQGSLILVGNGRSKVVDYDSLYQQEFDYSTYSSTVTGYDAEGRITSALVSLLIEDAPVMYILSGHDEVSLDTSFAEAIDKANITTEDLNLLTVDAVPEDAAAVLMFGAIGNLSTDDVTKLNAYVEAGGQLFIVTNYNNENNANLKSFLAGYGVTLYDGLISDMGDGHYYQNPFYLLPNIESTTFTSGSDYRYIFAPYAQGLKLDEENETYDLTPILTTSDSAAAKTDLNAISSYEAEDGDEVGQFVIGAKIAKADGSEGGIVVFTSPSLFSEAASEMVSGANLQLFSSIVASYNTETETVSIPVKTYGSEYNVVPQQYFIIVGLISVVFLPFGLLITGIVIWVKRRRA